MSNNTIYVRSFKINVIAAQVALGAPLEAVIPEGSSVRFWQQVLARYEARKASSPRRKATRRSPRSSGKRPASAASVQARAMAEQLDRVNGQYPVCGICDKPINTPDGFCPACQSEIDAPDLAELAEWLQGPDPECIPWDGSPAGEDEGYGLEARYR